MAVPDFQSWMLPLLQLAADGAPQRLQDAYERLAGELQLSDEEREQLLPSGRQRTYQNRIGWARTHLVKAGLLLAAGRGRFQISAAGQALLATRPQRVDMALLMQYPEYAAFREQGGEAVSPSRVAPAPTGTPDETLARLYLDLQESLAQELLEAVGAASPAFFERLVVELLVAMGYGGTAQDAGQAIGGSGDGGIDGIIKRDRLGLEKVYVQAKRWQGTVGSPEVRNLAGSLQMHHASRGVLITTGDFSREATDTAARLGTIALVNGAQLARLMIDFGVGVSTAATYVVKRLDPEYFGEL